eukprot:TRINITY_DN5783_c0_g2_i6.p1 TRINITY_DN5783_c0_g2~~TRINITY_DN5783_c0_g2_i6.p1  ORF type:complete len:251 (-),score=46.33 TRINITY_DN5783_c0_g2_i6:93-845(-)
MGDNCSKQLQTEDERLEFDTNRKINQIIKTEKKERRKIPRLKLLLLGTGDAGKSTFSKQLKVMHIGEFNTEEREYYKQVIYSNCLETMKKLVEACEKEEVIFPSKIKTHVAILKDSEEINEEVGRSIYHIWNDERVQKVFEKRHNDLRPPGGKSGAKYYLDNIKAICDTNYTPNDDAIFRAKIKTSGINECSFRYKETEFIIVDVGGQRSERNKWLHCFDEASAVLYIAALNEVRIILLIIIVAVIIKLP